MNIAPQYIIETLFIKKHYFLEVFALGKFIREFVAIYTRHDHK